MHQLHHVEGDVEKALAADVALVGVDRAGDVVVLVVEHKREQVSFGSRLPLPLLACLIQKGAENLGQGGTPYRYRKRGDMPRALGSPCVWRK